MSDWMPTLKTTDGHNMNEFITKNWMVLLAVGAAYWYYQTHNEKAILNNRYPNAYR